MSTLYELTDDYAGLLAALEFAESEDEETEIYAKLDALEGDITAKAATYARIIQDKDAEARAFAAEKTRLMECQRAAENVSKRLKAMLMDNMQRLGLREIRTDIGKWRIQMNPPSCEVLNPDAVPEDYRIPQPDKIDAAAILKNFRETGEIPDGVDIQRGESLRFR